jgi:hypothetical protein
MWMSRLADKLIDQAVNEVASELAEFCESVADQMYMAEFMTWQHALSKPTLRSRREEDCEYGAERSDRAARFVCCDWLGNVPSWPGQHLSFRLLWLARECTKLARATFIAGTLFLPEFRFVMTVVIWL